MPARRAPALGEETDARRDDAALLGRLLNRDHRRPRSQKDWKADVFDSEGIVGAAARVERAPDKKDRSAA